MANIQQNKSGNWEARVRVRGIYETRTFDSAAGAKWAVQVSNLRRPTCKRRSTVGLTARKITCATYCGCGNVAWHRMIDATPIIDATLIIDGRKEFYPSLARGDSQSEVPITGE